MMTTEDNRIMNIFIDYYDEIASSHLVEGCTGSSDPNEVQIIAAGIAGTLTINKLLKEERHNETV